MATFFSFFSPKTVIIKNNAVLKISKDLKKEIEMYKKFNFDYIPKLKYYFYTPNYDYLFIDYTGITLNNLQNPLNINQLMNLYITIKKTLKYLNNLSIIHRDIKPSNITYKNNRFYLIDYNLAAEYQEIKSYFFGNWEFCSLYILKSKLNNSVFNLQIVKNNDYISLIYIVLFFYTDKLLWTNVKDKFNLCQQRKKYIINRYIDIYNLKDNFILFLFKELKKYTID